MRFYHVYAKILDVITKTQKLFITKEIIVKEQQPVFNPLEEAKRIASGAPAPETERDRFYAALADEQDNISPDTAADFAKYLESRPYISVDGTRHNPKDSFAGKFPASFDHDELSRKQHYESTTKAYEEMETDELQDLIDLADAQGDLTSSINISDILRQKYTAQHSSEGTFELARSLAKAELSEDPVRVNALSDLLYEDIMKKAEKLVASVPESTESAQLDRLSHDIMTYKDRYKDRISTVEGQSSEDRNQETREDINIDRVRDFMAYLNKDGAPVSDILRDMPAEAFRDDISEEDFKKLLPDSLKDWAQHKYLSDSLDKKLSDKRVDQKFSNEKIKAFKDAGIPLEVITTIPASYFYGHEEPGATDDEGEVFRTYLEDNPGIAKLLHDEHDDLDFNNILGGGAAGTKKVDESGGSDAGEEVGEPEEEEDDVEGKIRKIVLRIKSEEADPEPGSSLFGRLKERFNRKAGVTFDKSGNAIVDEELGGFDISKKAAITALAVGGLAVLAAISAKNGGPNIADLWPFGADDAHRANELHENAPKGGGAWGNNLLDRLPDAADGASQAHETTRSVKAGVITDQYPTIWDNARHILEQQGIKNPSDVQIDALKDHIMKINGIDPNEAKNMPIGTRFNV